MLNNNFLKTFLFLSVFALFAQAQNKNFTVNTNLEGVVLSVTPMVPGYSLGSVKLNPTENNTFEGSVPLSSSGFYRLVVVKDGGQYFSVVYYPGTGDEAFDFDINSKAIDIKDTPDNRTLCNYAKIASFNDRALWHAEANEDTKLYTHLTNYIVAADSLLAVSDCSPAIKEYIKLWAYTSAYNGMHSAVRNAKRANHTLSFNGGDVMGDYGNLFDCTTATLFHETNMIVNATLPADTVLMAKFDALYSKYTNEDVRNTVSKHLFATFVARHNYAKDFNGGLEELKAVVEKYGLDHNIIDEYEKRRATIAGAAFPADVVLHDINGNVVDFSKFKGKYVFIDLWASWCVPCLKEIPHLQQLEKDMEGSDVVFVSVSIDEKPAAWKKKVQDAGLHGHQLIDISKRLYQALNLKGIPFFAIYDKEGCLYMLDAPRPSHPRLKPLLEGLK